MDTEDTRGEVERILEMNVVTSGPARTGRVEAVMRAIFLSAEAILEEMLCEFCLIDIGFGS